MIDKNKIDKNLKTILTKFSLKKNIQNLNISNYLDSIQILNLILEIEKKFNVKIKNKYMKEKNFKNFLSLKKLVINLLNEKK